MELAYGIGDDANVGFRAVLGACLGQVANNRGIGVEKIFQSKPNNNCIIISDFHTISGHSWLSWNTSGNYDNLGTSETFSESRGCLIVALDFALGVDMADIGSNT